MKKIGGSESSTKIGGPEIFTIVTLIIMSLALIRAFSFPRLAAIYPIFVCSIILICCIASLVRHFMGLSVTGGAIDIESDKSLSGWQRMKNASRGFIWFLVLYALAAVIGFKMGALIFMAAYISREAKERWPKVLALTALTLGVLIAFNKALNVWWNAGLLGEWEWFYDTVPWLF